MSLLDEFLMVFQSDGLKELPNAAEKAENALDDLSQKAEEAESNIKKVNKSTKTAENQLFAIGNAAEFGANGLNDLVVGGLKKLSPFVLALSALQNIFSNLQDAIDFKLPISRETVNNIKELEMTMRDVRSGAAQIGASIAELVLPVMNKLAKIAKTVLDFFKEHENFIKTAFIVTIIAMGAALWGALAPILPELLAITAAITFLSLIIDDFTTWLNGGNSALEDFWNEIFGSAKEARKFFEDIWKALKELWELLQPVFSWLLDVALKALVLDLKGVATLIKGIVKGINFLTGSKIDIKTDVDGSHADGLDYVPYDGYIAELHKGERVQTADEAQSWRSGLLAAKKAVDFTSSFPLNSIPQGAVSNAYNNSSANKTINIGDITIQTQATDAQGIAIDLAQYIKQAVISLDDGMIA